MSFSQRMYEAGYRTPTQIIEDYPDLKKWGWTRNYLGSLASGGVVTSKRTSKCTYIKMDSLRELVEFLNHRNDREKVTV